MRHQRIRTRGNQDFRVRGDVRTGLLLLHGPAVDFAAGACRLAPAFVSDNAILCEPMPGESRAGSFHTLQIKLSIFEGDLPYFSTDQPMQKDTTASLNPKPRTSVTASSQSGPVEQRATPLAREPGHGPQAQIRWLQQTVGNQAVLRQVTQFSSNPAAKASSEMTNHANGRFDRAPGRIAGALLPRRAPAMSNFTQCSKQRSNPIGQKRQQSSLKRQAKKLAKKPLQSRPAKASRRPSGSTRSW